jgi:hypothetical protein
MKSIMTLNSGKLQNGRASAMTLANFRKTAAAGAALALAVMLLTPPRAWAQDATDDAARIKIGFDVAPVPLNLAGKSVAQILQIGLGSYLVNAANDCNFCHTSGGPPNFNFLMNHNPYFLSQGPKKTDPTKYLAGGAPFGTALPFNVGPGKAYGTYLGPTIVARNLTPDKNGLPEGGHTLAQFMQILRTGVDMDHIHLTCTSPGPPPNPANCIPPPVNGAVLQIMPWPDFQNMADSDIKAIYEYLSAIPCIDNTTSTPPAGAPNELRNDCGNGPPPPPK